MVGPSLSPTSAIGIITDLYVDHFKFKGQNVTQTVPQLQRVLQDYSLEAVLAFFMR